MVEFKTREKAESDFENILLAFGHSILKNESPEIKKMLDKDEKWGKSMRKPLKQKPKLNKEQKELLKGTDTEKAFIKRILENQLVL